MSWSASSHKAGSLKRKFGSGSFNSVASEQHDTAALQCVVPARKAVPFLTEFLSTHGTPLGSGLGTSVPDTTRQSKRFKRKRKSKHERRKSHVVSHIVEFAHDLETNGLDSPTGKQLIGQIQPIVKASMRDGAREQADTDEAYDSKPSLAEAHAKNMGWNSSTDVASITHGSHVDTNTDQDSVDEAFSETNATATYDDYAGINESEDDASVKVKVEGNMSPVAQGLPDLQSYHAGMRQAPRFSWEHFRTTTTSPRQLRDESPARVDSQPAYPDLRGLVAGTISRSSHSPARNENLSIERFSSAGGTPISLAAHVPGLESPSLAMRPKDTLSSLHTEPCGRAEPDAIHTSLANSTDLTRHDTTYSETNEDGDKGSGESISDAGGDHPHPLVDELYAEALKLTDDRARALPKGRRSGSEPPQSFQRIEANVEVRPPISADTNRQFGYLVPIHHSQRALRTEWASDHMTLFAQSQSRSSNPNSQDETNGQGTTMILTRTQQLDRREQSLDHSVFSDEDDSGLMPGFPEEDGSERSENLLEESEILELEDDPSDADTSSTYQQSSGLSRCSSPSPTPRSRGAPPLPKPTQNVESMLTRYGTEWDPFLKVTEYAADWKREVILKRGQRSPGTQYSFQSPPRASQASLSMTQSMLLDLGSAVRSGSLLAYSNSSPANSIFSHDHRRHSSSTAASFWPRTSGGKKKATKQGYSSADFREYQRQQLPMNDSQAPAPSFTAPSLDLSQARTSVGVLNNCQAPRLPQHDGQTKAASQRRKCKMRSSGMCRCGTRVTPPSVPLDMQYLSANAAHLLTSGEKHLAKRQKTGQESKALTVSQDAEGEAVQTLPPLNVDSCAGVEDEINQSPFIQHWHENTEPRRDDLHQIPSTNLRQSSRGVGLLSRLLTSFWPSSQQDKVHNKREKDIAMERSQEMNSQMTRSKVDPQLKQTVNNTITDDELHEIIDDNIAFMNV